MQQFCVYSNAWKDYSPPYIKELYKGWKVDYGAFCVVCRVKLGLGSIRLLKGAEL